jgi:hypothetical protein
MAYIGRGGFPSFGGGVDDGIGTPNDNNNNNGHNGRMYYRGGFFRMYYYIPLDNTYVIFQMIASIIIFIIAGIVFLTTYKSSIVDPIEDTKRIIINIDIIIILLLLGFTLLSNYFSKDKFALTKRLIAILSLTIITTLVFLGIKVNLDLTYTSNKFEQIYEQEYSEQSSDIKSKIDIGLTGMSIKSEKEYYIDKCIEAYNIFSIKMYGIMGINIFLIVLLIYQIAKVSNIQEKRDRLSKDDAILFDEEENIKM